MPSAVIEQPLRTTRVALKKVRRHPNGHSLNGRTVYPLHIGGPPCQGFGSATKTCAQDALRPVKKRKVERILTERS